MGAAAYQRSSPNTEYCKTELRPVLFLSQVLTPAESRYWPTELEFSGLVWAVRKLTTYIEHTHTTLTTGHKPRVDIANMTGLATTSTARANFRLQTWSAFLSQYADQITITYAKGKDMEVPDALSCMRVEVAERRAKSLALAEALRPQGPMADLKVDPGLWGETEAEATTSVSEPAEAAESGGQVGVTAHLSEEFASKIRQGYQRNGRVLNQINHLQRVGAQRADDAAVTFEECNSFVLMRASKSEEEPLLYFEDPATGSK
jgi:hypothetical protein